MTWCQLYIRSLRTSKLGLTYSRNSIKYFSSSRIYFFCFYKSWSPTNTNKASLKAEVISLRAFSSLENLMIKWPNTYRNDSILWIAMCASSSSNIQFMNVDVSYARIRKAYIILPKYIQWCNQAQHNTNWIKKYHKARSTYQWVSQKKNMHIFLYTTLGHWIIVVFLV